MRSCESAGARRRLAHAALGAAMVLGPGALATEASATTLGVNRPCYVLAGKAPPQMTVLATGFTAGDPVTVSSSDGSVDTTATADGNGNIGLTVAAPTPFFALPGAQSVTLTAQDFTTNGTTTTAATPINVAPFAVATRPSVARLTNKVTWFFSGFRPGKFIYVHYLRKKQVARARFGRSQGPCGVYKVRARLYPGGHPHHKSYGIQIDDSKRYSKHVSPRTVTKHSTFLL